MPPHVLIDGNRVNVAPILNSHPGGRYCLETHDECDVTDLFHSIHRGVNYSHLIVVGVVGVVGAGHTKDEATHVHEFRKLHEWMKQNGWYKPCLMHFAKHIMVELALFSISVCMTLNGLSVLGAFTMGVFWHHSAGIGHDLGHSSVFEQRWTNRIVGSCMSAFTGLSSLWWRHSHFQHHIHTNVLPQDPDIMHLPIFAITEKIFSHEVHKFLNVKISPDRLNVALIMMQHITLYPLLFLARFNLYAQSILHLFNGFDASSKNATLHAVEQSGIVLFFSWYMLLLSTLSTWKERIIFLLLSHMTSGILHVQIVISHWVSETYSSQIEDHYLHTLKTTMDIECSEWIDWAHLGLQFQITHHMFPRLPRYHLREATEYVKRICEEHNLPYRCCTFSHANVLLYRNMCTVAKSIRQDRSAKR